MSRQVDLLGEYQAALAAQDPPRRARLGELGLIKPAHRIGLVGYARVLFQSGTFEPNAAGEPALIFPVVDGPTLSVPTTLAEKPGQLVDLVAWHPARPTEMALRVGNAFALGEEEIRDAIVSQSPLRVFRDPGSWAAASAEGAVIVDWDGAQDLLQLSVIVADDVDHGAIVQRQLKLLRSRMLKRLPRVRVPLSSIASAQ
jgi:hypothetical protein